MSESGAEYPTTIGADAKFKGELKFEKGARLLGQFEGQIVSQGEFVVAKGAKFSGEAQAGDMRIEGSVKGNLQASGKIHLAASARLEGDIQATRLEVTEGAVLIGRCTIGENSDAKSPAAGKPRSVPAEQVVTQVPARERPAGKPTTVAGRK